MTYIGLVAAAFDDLWALASKAIMSLACIAGDAPARSYQEKMREMKGEMKRQLSRPFQLSSECEVWSDCPVAVSFVALLDRVQELQHRLASGGGGEGGDANEAVPVQDQINLIQAEWRQCKDGVEVLLQTLAHTVAATAAEEEKAREKGERDSVLQDSKGRGQTAA
jgi:hypothetical protein